MCTIIYFRNQAIIDSNNAELKTTKNLSVIEKCIEPETLLTDSFITEDSDGRKVNVTRQISSRKVKRIIYLEDVCYYY